MAFKTILKSFPTKPYSRVDLRKLLRSDDEDSIQQVKKYVKQYFFKTYSGFVFIDYDENGLPYIIHQKNENLSNYIPKDAKKFDEDGKPIFTLMNWFYGAFGDINYKLVFEPSKPQVYSMNGSNYVNCFVNILRNNGQYADYSKDVKEKLQRILYHLKKIWCENNEELYLYLLAWLRNLVLFKKNETYIYLRGEEGCGKGIILDFIRNYILKHLAFTTSNPDILTGWNEILRSKTLMILEELPALSTAQWLTYNEKLKDMATSDTLDIRERYHNTLQIKNYLSMVLITNNDPLKLTARNRRAVPITPSNEKIGDFSYMNSLADATNNQDVANAFVAYLTEHKEASKVNLKKLPETEASKELVLRHLAPHIDFVKKFFYLKKKDFNKSLKETYELYISAMKAKTSMIEFNRLLKNLGFKEKAKNVNGKTKKMWNVSFEELEKIFKDRKFIHEDDEFEDDDIDDDSDNDSVYEISKKDKEIDELKKQIEELKKQLEEAKKEKKPKRKTKKSE